jgi:P27 family predicted phage terminase small subunit
VTKSTVPAPPKHLCPRGRELWQSLVSEYQIDDAAALELLRRACEASDRADQALEQLERDGLTVTNRFGEVRAHPAVAIERDARNAQRQLLRELRLTEPVPADDQARLPRLGRP